MPKQESKNIPKTKKPAPLTQDLISITEHIRQAGERVREKRYGLAAVEYESAIKKMRVFIKLC